MARKTTPYSGPYSAPYSSGFSLIELVVTLSLMAVLSTLAFSKLKDNHNRSSARSAGAAFDQAMRYAHSEARTRTNAGTGEVRICALNSDQDDCRLTTSTEWQDGWQVYVENDGTPGIGNADQRLRQATTSGSVLVYSGLLDDAGSFTATAFRNSILDFGLYSTTAKNSSGTEDLNSLAFQFAYASSNGTVSVSQVAISTKGQASMTNLIN